MATDLTDPDQHITINQPKKWLKIAAGALTLVGLVVGAAFAAGGTSASTTNKLQEHTAQIVSLQRTLPEISESVSEFRITVVEAMTELKTSVKELKAQNSSFLETHWRGLLDRMNNFENHLSNIESKIGRNR